MRYPLIALAIPVFNSGRTLQTVLSRIAELTYQKSRIRMIFAYTKSEDDTLGIVMDFRTHFGDVFESFRVINAPKGIPSARNVCIDAAEGCDYIFYLDSDIVPPRNIIEILLAHFEEDHSLAAVNMPYDGIQHRQYWKFMFNWLRIKRPFAYSYKINQGSTLYSMKAVLKTGKFSERLRVHEDWEYSLRLRRNGYRLGTDWSDFCEHLKPLETGPRYYARFLRDSARTYAEMIKHRSTLHLARLAASVLLAFSVLMLVSGLDVIWATILIFSLLLSSILATYPSGLDNGLTIRAPYILPAGLVLMIPIAINSFLSLAVLINDLVLNQRYRA